MSNISNVQASHSGTKVTVTGNANGNDNVRVLVNPQLGPDQQTVEAIYRDYDTIRAVGKGQKDVTSGSFTIAVDVGSNQPPFNVRVVSRTSKGENPVISVTQMA